jgi:aminoglycoside phosphotransferase (APT) family kinase protein
MTEITPAEREAIWLGGFDAMARIHRLDLDATGFGFLRRPELGATPLDQEITYYESTTSGQARGRANPTLEAAHDWLVANKPGPEREGLVWGDARIGNMIFDGTKPAAVLDWEMVSAGSPERDVGWAIFLDRHHSEGIDTPRLAGFPSYEDTIAFYEERSGTACATSTITRSLRAGASASSCCGSRSRWCTTSSRRRAGPRARAQQHGHAPDREAARAARSGCDQRRRLLEIVTAPRPI